MAHRLVIDPMTRIEGHLRIELAVSGEGVIEDAYCSGTMVRGIERILVGRDPREAWAFAQRACGVCTFVHALASVRAVEDALGISVPPAAAHLRNLMLAQQFVHDHVMHFYHLHALDWVDPRSALEADPSETAALQRSISDWPQNSAEHFAQIQERLRALLESDRPSLLAAGHWGHPAYRLPPAVDLLAMAHYFEALDWQATATVIHILAGGKNPHPNLLVGGVPAPIDYAGTGALGEAQLARIEASIADLRRFVDQVYLPDVLAIGKFYRDYASLGEGTGCFLTWGEFAEYGNGAAEAFVVPRAAIVDRQTSGAITPDPRDESQNQEFVARSWYRYPDGEAGRHPWRGTTELAYEGPQPPYDQLDVDHKYSWLKAPRWQGRPMEVGPLARVAVSLASGDQTTARLVSSALDALQLPPESLYSTLGRTLARALETKLIADSMPSMLAALRSVIRDGRAATFAGAHWDPATWPRYARGFGAAEAPRGALGHWITIEDGRIRNYQIVAPTTWNASPRDPSGQRGPYEAALVGTRLAVPDVPLEAWRTIRSFDPCLACAVH